MLEACDILKKKEKKEGKKKKKGGKREEKEKVLGLPPQVEIQLAT